MRWWEIVLDWALKRDNRQAKRCPCGGRAYWGCSTCGRTPERHNIACLCQDFTWLCSRCRMAVW